MPTKMKKIYAVYFIKKNHHICMLEISRESIKERKLKRETIYERKDEWCFYTTDISPEHIKHVFKRYFMEYYRGIINDIDNYKGE